MQTQPRTPDAPEPTAAARPCEDCVDVHGDDPADWLATDPAGAPYRTMYDTHLCDGCYDDRIDSDVAIEADLRERGLDYSEEWLAL